MYLCKKNINFNILLLHFAMLFFKAFGLFPLTLKVLATSWTKKVNTNVKFINSTKGIIYHIILSSYFIFIIPFSLSSETYEEFSFIESTIKALLLICENTGCSLVILIYIFQRQSIINISNRLLRFEHKLRDNSGHNCNLENGKFYRIMISIIQSIIMIALWVSEVMANRYGKIYPFIRIFPKLFITSVILQYTFLLIFIHKRFQYLNKSLLSTTTYNSQNTISYVQLEISPNRSSSKDIIMSRLIFLRQAHRTLYEITYSITEFYSWPILFAITGSCTRLILSLYYLIMVIMSVKAVSITRYVLAFLWVIVFIFPIIPLTGFVTRISTEIKKTGDIVNKIMNKYSTQIKIHYELEQFSIELLHRKLRFTACGLFSLDGGLVTSMTSTMITYMIILVQFKDSILTTPMPTTPSTPPTAATVMYT